MLYFPGLSVSGGLSPGVAQQLHDACQPAILCMCNFVSFAACRSQQRFLLAISVCYATRVMDSRALSKTCEGVSEVDMSTARCGLGYQVGMVSWHMPAVLSACHMLSLKLPWLVQIAKV
jgi:hypothetical protein